MMKLESTREIPLSIDDTWKVINDLAILKECIPGCERLERQADGSLLATVLAKVGPVSARFSGNIAFQDVVEPVSYRLVFSGHGGAAGFAKGHADVSLEDTGGSTRLHYKSEASIGGKLAQIGSRLVEGTARKLSDDFFSRLESEARAASSAGVMAAPVPNPASGAVCSQPVTSINLAKWVGIGVAVVIVVLVLVTR
jgi:carbon monoxide dehydrogenase subunit G